MLYSFSYVILISLYDSIFRFLFEWLDLLFQKEIFQVMIPAVFQIQLPHFVKHVVIITLNVSKFRAETMPLIFFITKRPWIKSKKDPYLKCYRDLLKN